MLVKSGAGEHVGEVGDRSGSLGGYRRQNLGADGGVGARLVRLRVFRRRCEAEVVDRVGNYVEVGR